MRNNPRDNKRTPKQKTEGQHKEQPEVTTRNNRRETTRNNSSETMKKKTDRHLNEHYEGNSPRDTKRKIQT